MGYYGYVYWPIPVITWETCRCLKTGVAVWPDGFGDHCYTECTSCGQETETDIVWATAN